MGHQRFDERQVPVPLQTVAVGDIVEAALIELQLLPQNGKAAQIPGEIVFSFLPEQHLFLPAARREAVFLLLAPPGQKSLRDLAPAFVQKAAQPLSVFFPFAKGDPQTALALSGAGQSRSAFRPLVPVPVIVPRETASQHRELILVKLAQPPIDRNRGTGIAAFRQSAGDGVADLPAFSGGQDLLSQVFRGHVAREIPERAVRAFGREHMPKYAVHQHMTEILLADLRAGPVIKREPVGPEGEDAAVRPAGHGHYGAAQERKSHARVELPAGQELFGVGGLCRLRLFPGPGGRGNGVGHLRVGQKKPEREGKIYRLLLHARGKSGGEEISAQGFGEKKTVSALKDAAQSRSAVPAQQLLALGRRVCGKKAVVHGAPQHFVGDRVTLSGAH